MSVLVGISEVKGLAQTGMLLLLFPSIEGRGVGTAMCCESTGFTLQLMWSLGLLSK